MTPLYKNQNFKIGEKVIADTCDGRFPVEIIDGRAIKDEADRMLRLYHVKNALGNITEMSENCLKRGFNIIDGGLA